MKDDLIPLGLLLFIGFFGYAMIHSARKQRNTKRTVFRDFAARNGLRYQEQDDGQAQEFAQGFDGVGRFMSSSLGKVIPKDVVSGDLNSMHAILFRHSIRYGEGWSREWFVAGLIGAEPIAERCSVQFCKRRADKSTMHLADAVVKDQKVGPFDVVVRAPTPSHAGRMLDDRVLQQAAGFARELPFRPEIQFRGRRAIAYLADRNATVDNVETLGKLFEFTERMASI
jgi:hypothetical protein